MFTMRLYNKVGFFDNISRKYIAYYEDKYGDIYMSEYPYYPFKFRVKYPKSIN